jgi:hypothetical protein
MKSLVPQRHRRRRGGSRCLRSRATGPVPLASLEHRMRVLGGLLEKILAQPLVGGRARAGHVERGPQATPDGVVGSGEAPSQLRPRAGYVHLRHRGEVRPDRQRGEGTSRERGRTVGVVRARGVVRGRVEVIHIKVLAGHDEIRCAVMVNQEHGARACRGQMCQGSGNQFSRQKRRARCRDFELAADTRRRRQAETSLGREVSPKGQIIRCTVHVPRKSQWAPQQGLLQTHIQRSFQIEHRRNVHRERCN